MTMDKKFAPAYTNISMAEWETSALALASCRKMSLHYIRYMDDIWSIWTHSKEEFGEFLNVFNQHNLCIKVKSTPSFTVLDFWIEPPSFEIFKTGRKLDVKAYFIYLKQIRIHCCLRTVSNQYT